MNNYHYLFKFIVVGDSNVGKSCILLQYTEAQFRQQQDVTVGVEYGSKELIYKEKRIKLQIWDTAGQESFRSITRAYYRGSIACILVYDVTKRASLDSLRHWYAEVKADSTEQIETLVVGNKIDLSKREVSYEEGQKLADSIGSQYVETSAKTGENIDLIFDTLVHQVYHKIKSGIVNMDEPNLGIKVGQLNSATKVKQLCTPKDEDNVYCC